MNIAITMTHCSRPKYSALSLASVARAIAMAQPDVIVGWVLMHIEPGSREVQDVCTRWMGNIRAMDVPTSMVVNAVTKRVNRNTASVMQAAFEDGADFVLHVEDDVLLAPDALRWFAWAAREYELDHPETVGRVVTVTGYHRPRPDVLPPWTRWHDAEQRHWFHPWGWGTWRDRWVGRGAKGGVMSGVNLDAGMTWDVQVNASMAAQRWTEVYPVLARTQNIGHYSSVHPGVYSPEWYAQHHTLTHWAGAKGVDVPLGAFNACGVNDAEDLHRAQELAQLATLAGSW